MPAWLVEGSAYIYFVLVCAFIALLYAWWRTRKPRYAIAAGAVAALIAGYVALDHYFESDGEQMTRKVREVAAAVSAKNVVAALDHVSESFDRHGMNKDQFRKYCELHLSRGDVTAVQVWDLTAVDVSRKSATGTVQFRFKVHGGWGESPPNWFGRVVFALDPDGQWRVKTFDVFDSLNQSNTPVAIPEWGGR
jgi:hypothetical protein